MYFILLGFDDRATPGSSQGCLCDQGSILVEFGGPYEVLGIESRVDHRQGNYPSGPLLCNFKSLSRDLSLSLLHPPYTTLDDQSYTHIMLLGIVHTSDSTKYNPLFFSQHIYFDSC